MNILVDTSVWSLALRRDNSTGNNLEIIKELKNLIEENRAVLASPIVQELLSGLKDITQFNKLEKKLKPFVLLDINHDDYVNAAKLYNKCRSKGIQGSHTDYLLCALAIRFKIPIFTVDNDFHHYAKHIKLQLHKLRS